ncbi:hypothetical protein WAI453_013127 [Rhynchosporium graminicola]
MNVLLIYMTEEYSLRQQILVQWIGERSGMHLYVTKQGVREESGETALLERIGNESNSRNNSEVQDDEDPMLSDLTAEDWESNIHLFRLRPYKLSAFALILFDSVPVLGTSSSQI